MVYGTATDPITHAPPSHKKIADHTYVLTDLSIGNATSDKLPPTPQITKICVDGAKRTT